MREMYTVGVSLHAGLFPKNPFRHIIAADEMTTMMVVVVVEYLFNKQYG